VRGQFIPEEGEKGKGGKKGKRPIWEGGGGKKKNVEKGKAH